jgi:hypothetical protein
MQYSNVSECLRIATSEDSLVNYDILGATCKLSSETLSDSDRSIVAHGISALYANLEICIERERIERKERKKRNLGIE